MQLNITLEVDQIEVDPRDFTVRVRYAPRDQNGEQVGPYHRISLNCESDPNADINFPWRGETHHVEDVVKEVAKKMWTKTRVAEVKKARKKERDAERAAKRA